MKTIPGTSRQPAWRANKATRPAATHMRATTSRSRGLDGRRPARTSAGWLACCCGRRPWLRDPCFEPCFRDLATEATLAS